MNFNIISKEIQLVIFLDFFTSLALGYSQRVWIIYEKYKHFIVMAE